MAEDASASRQRSDDHVDDQTIADQVTQSGLRTGSGPEKLESEAQSRLDLDIPPPSARVTVEALTRSPLMHNLEELVETSRRAVIRDRRAAGVMSTVAFFDITGSTHTTRRLGDDEGAMQSQWFAEVAISIVNRWDGKVLRVIGDGVLSTFSEPVNAVYAALNMRRAADLMDMEMTAGLTAGVAVRQRLHGFDDILGDVVNTAFRVQARAIPGQVLVERSLYSLVRGALIGDNSVVMSNQSRQFRAKGTGVLEVFEVAFGDEWDLAEHLATPWEVRHEGRPTALDKTNLIAGAHSEIIEIGIGLTSFAKYFTGEKSGDFKEPFRAAVRSGVNLRCFALDFDYGPGADWEEAQGNTRYREEARWARDVLMEERRALRRERALGEISYHLYRRVPEFWCLGVDVEDPISGRMFYAPYLMDMPRAENIVFEVSRQSHSAVYDKFLRTIRALRASSDER